MQAAEWVGGGTGPLPSLIVLPPLSSPHLLSVAQPGLKIMNSGDLPSLPPKCLETIGACHHAWLVLDLFGSSNPLKIC